MRKLLTKIRNWHRRRFEKCEWCHGRLKNKDDHYYGGIEINDTIGDSRKRTAYVCNLCYHIYKKIDA